MTYWKELPETFTCVWDLSQISDANLLFAIASLTRKDMNRFLKKGNTFCLSAF